ncbi:MAG TPA: segregation/condensation protein A [Candidatus Paceibacterota bacterium]
MGDQYQVKTHIFEGPLDTLLSLIEKRKLFINDISLAQVADDYISYVKSLENFPIADSAHFILIASTLVLIKSKSLLPTLNLSEEEEASIEDLENRLKEYQKYKTLSKHLKDRFGIDVEYFRLPSKEKVVVFAPDKNVTTSKMQEVIKSIIAQIPKKEFVPKVIVDKVISLEEMMDNLAERITKSMKMSFREFSRLPSSSTSGKGGQAGHDPQARVHVIVAFLAMLELVKQGIIHVRQDRDFHDIEIQSDTISVPRY